jgi:23S rRNA (adenine2503-C2)-methyltransferase
MHVHDILERLTALGAKPAHAGRVLRLWTHALPQDSGARRPEDFLPRALREARPALT